VSCCGWVSAFWTAGINTITRSCAIQNNSFSVVNPAHAGAPNRVSQDVDVGTSALATNPAACHSQLLSFLKSLEN
jgi:hypothetical protein